jgi:uroporphyrinogen decarboxylase
MQVSFTPEFAERLRADLEGRAASVQGTGHGEQGTAAGPGAETGRPFGDAETDSPPAGPRGRPGPAYAGTSPLAAAPSVGPAGEGAHGHNPHGGGNTYELERAIGEDLLLTSVGWANSYYQGDGVYTDEWGVTWRPVPYATPFGPGRYTEMVQHPLAEDGAISGYHAPDPNRPELYADAQWTLDRFKDEFWITGVTVTTIWETAWALRGYDRLLSDLVTAPELAEAILDIPYRYHLAAARRLVEMGVDMIWIGDDVGSQRAMLISPAHWRRFLKPRMAGFIAALKAANPRVKVAYHSDGVVWPILPDLIEIGLDILNPVQPACMDPAELKARYGEQLCFWGSIDEQQTLPFGTAEEVRGEVLERLRTIGRGGGLIIGPTHHVQLDTPMENFWSMVNAITGTPYAALAGARRAPYNGGRLETALTAGTG